MKCVFSLVLLCLPVLVACSDGSDAPGQTLPFVFADPLPLRQPSDPYNLPDPLVMGDGSAVTSAQHWWHGRRPEILALFESQVYGTVPAQDIAVRFELVEEGAALAGAAMRRQIRAHFGDGSVGMHILIYLPAAASGHVPVFANLNFRGNHTVNADPAILVPAGEDPAERGARSSRYPLADIIGAGYALATAWYADLDPDFDDGFQNGIHPLFSPDGSPPGPDEWGAVGAWAWGLSRILDYVETDADLDAGRVATVGHSRLGKTALWAGALDTRFAMGISNNSGAVGAALSRRARGETVAIINQIFPHWFADNFVQYGDNEELLPVDQHQLIALLAPRPVYVASAEEDFWADPPGEFESLLYASDVYRLLGREGLAVTAQPPLHTPVTSVLGYHLRSGGHDLTRYDWLQFIVFADRHL